MEHEVFELLLIVVILIVFGGSREKTEMDDLILTFFNEATPEELLSINHCSKTKVQKIISIRPYEDYDDLVRIHHYCLTLLQWDHFIIMDKHAQNAENNGFTWNICCHLVSPKSPIAAI